jgi:hypothetical protein
MANNQSQKAQDANTSKYIEVFKEKFYTKQLSSGFKSRKDNFKNKYFLLAWL